MTKLNVVSSARKLILSVPAGLRASFPAGAAISPYGQNNEAPAVVVCNRTDTSQGPDGTWQGADGVNGVIIVNEVPQHLAEQALDIYDSLHEPYYTIDKAIAFLEANGCGDIYTTSKEFVRTKLTPAGRMVETYTGIVKRDDRDVCTMWRDPAGVYWVQLPKGEPRHIEADIILRTYVQADGSPIDLTAIPVVA
jgi:hypothetical protein